MRTHTYTHVYIIDKKRKRKNLGGPGETITTLTNGDVEDKLLHFDFPHWVTQFLLGSLHRLFLFIYCVLENTGKQS